jgi:hypothetical protein
MAHGQVLLQWQATGYHIAFMFSAEGRMLRITHVLALVAVVVIAAVWIILAVASLPFPFLKSGESSYHRTSHQIIPDLQIGQHVPFNPFCIAGHF